MPVNRIDVLIVDDEQISREGFRNLIDWGKLGFQICAEAADGEEALEKIRAYQPGLVLLDIRLPGISGIDVLMKAREEGFDGEVIILSGFSDFDYAREAIKYRAVNYLVKPVDSRELENAIIALRGKLSKKKKNLALQHQYYSVVREKVLYDLLTGSSLNPLVNYYDFGYTEDVYQVVIFESYHKDSPTKDLGLLLTDEAGNPVKMAETRIDRRRVILLIGSAAVGRFGDWINHQKGDVEKNSYMDSIFAVCGDAVSRLDDVSTSYRQCLRLISRRFYCDRREHIMTIDQLSSTSSVPLSQNFLNEISEKIYSCLSCGDADGVRGVFSETRELLMNHGFSGMAARHYLIDVFFGIRNMAVHQFGEELKKSFSSKLNVIQDVDEMDYYDDVADYICTELGKLPFEQQTHGSENAVDRMSAYIDRHYAEHITLESIADRLGYNSAYLGKLFAARTGISFNAYLEKVRIGQARERLVNTDDLVQDIAAGVGYKYIDVFNQKFRKLTGVSPTEYRKMGRSSN